MERAWLFRRRSCGLVTVIRSGNLVVGGHLELARSRYALARNLGDRDPAVQGRFRDDRKLEDQIHASGHNKVWVACPPVKRTV